MVMMVKIGFNGWFLKRLETGSGQYSRKLLEVLASRAEVRVLIPEARHLPESKGLLNLYKVWFESVLFPRYCLKEQVDVAFVPYMGPPLFSPRPLVVTVHDLIPFLFPEYSYSPAVKLYNALVKKAVPKARFILADSASTRGDVLRCFKISPEKVEVVYPGIGEEFRPVEDRAGAEEVVRGYGIRGPFFLYLGGFDRRKNLGLLLEAYCLFRERCPGEVPALVIAGKVPSRESPVLINPLKMVLEKGLKGSVLFTGWIAEEHKPALYSLAEAFVFPSLYEGFGFPPLEAMACGCPVLASSSSSLPEVLDGGALLLDPRDPEEWAASMERILREPELSQALREKGLRRAREFSWETTALSALSILEKAAGRGNP
ncbi:MAG: glycosyltransferase family 1 protein [Anaerolineae bacterium]|nr:glycosyltransferase family 4 protein [Anaerolineae bacterium]MDW8102521.1 glycosyltransferase family 1 protein [Anaerolineae bacterium]